MQDTARKALVASLIVVAVVASALALWKLRILVAGLFLALIIAAAMRPSVEWLAQRRIPRGIGILLHYALLGGLIGLPLARLLGARFIYHNEGFYPDEQVDGGVWRFGSLPHRVGRSRVRAANSSAMVRPVAVARTFSMRVK